MLERRLMVSILSVGIMTSGTGVAFGQNYPVKPIRIVTSEVGGGADFQARLIALGLTGAWGQQVIVDNRAGILPAEVAAKASPDGYTLLYNGSAHWLTPFLQDHVPYDPVRDFSPVTLAVRAPNILVVHPAVAAKSVKELIALAKARPGELNDAGANAGSSAYIAAELFKAMAGINVVRIPYKGVGPALNALIGGEAQLMFPSAGSVTPHVKSGRVRALAVSSAEPSALAPGLPTVAASGVPGYVAAAVVGVFVPAATPATLVNRINQEIVRAINRADMKEKFFNSGVEVVGSSPEAFRATVAAEMARLGKLLKASGIREGY